MTDKCGAPGGAEDAPMRWLLLIEVQRCIWDSPAALPDVDIRDATVLHSYKSREEASVAAKAYLAEVGAEAIGADVRPIEACACCGKDFETHRWHSTLTISEESGPETAPEVLEVDYVARFCGKCVPV
jgi:hypothetical protein